MQTRPPAVGGRLGAEIVEDTWGFAVLEEEWERLHDACPAATPFQSWAWLYSWWEHHSGEYDLRLVTVRDEGGLLVGAAPFALERRAGFGRLLFAGTGKTIYQDLLAREGREEDVARAVAGALRGMGGWAVADLQEVRPGAAAWALFRNWTGPRTAVWQGYCTLVEARPWEEVLASLSKNHRSTTRRSLRRAAAEGARWELVGPGGAEEAAGDLVALNREQWRERWRDTSPEHWSPRFGAHLRSAARRMASRGLGGISRLRKGDETVLSTFLLFGRDSVGLYMVGASKEAFERYSYSSLFVRDMLDVARSLSLPLIDFYRGEDAYKLRWNPRVADNHRIILGKDLARWAPYAGYLNLRFKAVRYALSEDSPEWAREAARRYVRLRYRALRFAERANVVGRAREATTRGVQHQMPENRGRREDA